MGKETLVDYNALQGNSFFEIAKQTSEYVYNQISAIHPTATSTAGNAAVYGIVAHKRILSNSVNPKFKDGPNLYALFDNTATMMLDLGLKFEQIDERLKGAIAQEHEDSAK